VGCSKEESSTWISSDGSSIYINDKPVLLNSFDGSIGIYNNENDFVNFTFKTCDSNFRNCPENRQGVYESDLIEYKNAKYFDGFIDTFSCMHMPNDESTSKEVVINTKDTNIKPLSIVREDAYFILENIKFEPINKSTFANTIIINSNGNNMIIRNTDITIPGILSVFKGTKDVTQQVEINGITCMLYESSLFNFYQYGGNIIKISKDINVNEYIELKSIQ
jgi:hypothetical protein